MTKAIRIENADTGNYKVRVRTFDKGVDGAPDVLANTQILGHPTAMTDGGTCLTSTRYVIVDEVPADTP